MPEFLVLVGCESDESGKRFEPGDTVTKDDFPEAVILNWVEIGVLRALTPDAPAEQEASNGRQE